MEVGDEPRNREESTCHQPSQQLDHSAQERHVKDWGVAALEGATEGLRAEPVLATPVSRTAWLLSWIMVTALGILWLLLLAGLGNGLGAGLTMGDWELLVPVVIGHIMHTPAVWLLLGIAVALYGFAPRFIGLSWLVFVYSTMLSFFGEMLNLDEAVLATSVFRHVGEYPAQDISWSAVGGLTLFGVTLTAIGSLCFRRRDLITA